MIEERKLDLFLNFFFAIYALTVVSFFWQNYLFLTGLLFLGSLGMLSLRRETEEYVLFLTGGLIGASAEIVAISYGEWSYTEPQLLGIPVWLPLVWGMATLFIERMASELHEYFVASN